MAYFAVSQAAILIVVGRHFQLSLIIMEPCARYWHSPATDSDSSERPAISDVQGHRLTGKGCPDTPPATILEEVRRERRQLAPVNPVDCRHDARVEARLAAAGSPHGVLATPNMAWPLVLNGWQPQLCPDALG